MMLNTTQIDDESLWKRNDLIKVPVPGLIANQSVTIQLAGNGFNSSTETIMLTTAADADTTPPVITGFSA
jgi:hypothetical protein